MKIDKSILQLLVLVVVVVVAGNFLLGEKSSSNVVLSGEVIAPTGGIQKVVLGMKDYNYYPETITVDAGNTVRLSIDESAYGCFRDFTIREFGVRKYLKTASDYVEFVPDRKGTFTFSCSMGMGLGKLIVN